MGVYFVVDVSELLLHILPGSGYEWGNRRSEDTSAENSVWDRVPMGTVQALFFCRTKHTIYSFQRLETFPWRGSCKYAILFAVIEAGNG